MSFITSWAQGIIVSVIVATIIEMLLPQNGNGKYVKVVIGIFVLFTIVSPVIGKFKNDINSTSFDTYLADIESDAIQTSNTGFSNEEAIKMMYEENLKIDIKSKISQKGYTVGEIELEILNNDEYTLNGIKVKIIERTQNQSSQGRNLNRTVTIIDNIENVKINLGGSAKDNNEKSEPSILNESEKRKLKEYLSSVYEVNENNIVVN
ncbi:MAG: stage III sporulation protein AF [Clostridia bacterium]|nr:stage III sporulation protein AF [Clostridia bacterium]